MTARTTSLVTAATAMLLREGATMTRLVATRRARATLVAGAAFGAWFLRHRVSPAVRAWTPGGGHRRRAGLLSVRTYGQGDEVVVLLHGLTGSGDWFGGGFDGLGQDAQVVVPDLLGFGRSMDVTCKDFSLEAHLAALDDMLGVLGLTAAPLTVVGHSMGAVLAVHWAARRSNARRVVAFCAPLYTSREEAARHIARMGLLEKLFALESPLARWTCAWMCKHRGVAQWVAVAASPEWPVPLARQGVLHTWPAYLGGMNGIIQRPGWKQALQALDARGTAVVLADGADDPVPVSGRSACLAAGFRCVQAVEHPAATHDLPVAHPEWSLALTRGEP